MKRQFLYQITEVQSKSRLSFNNQIEIQNTHISKLQLQQSNFSSFHILDSIHMFSPYTNKDQFIFHKEKQIYNSISRNNQNCNNNIKSIFRDPYLDQQQSSFQKQNYSQIFQKNNNFQKGQQKKLFYKQLQISRKLAQLELAEITNQFNNSINNTLKIQNNQDTQHKFDFEMQSILNPNTFSKLKKIQFMINSKKQNNACKSKINQKCQKQNNITAYPLTERKQIDHIKKQLKKNENNLNKISYKFVENIEMSKTIKQKINENIKQQQQSLKFYQNINQYQEKKFQFFQIKPRFDYFEHLFTSILWIDKQLLKMLNIFPIQFKQIVKVLPDILYKETFHLIKFINNLIPTNLKKVKSLKENLNWKQYTIKLLQKSKKQWEKRINIPQYWRILQEKGTSTIILKIRQLANSKRLEVQLLQFDVLEYRINQDKTN